VKAEYWRLLQTILAAIFPFMCEVSVIFAGRIAHRDQQVAMIAEGGGGRTFGLDRGGDRRGVHTAGRNCDARFGCDRGCGHTSKHNASPSRRTRNIYRHPSRMGTLSFAGAFLAVLTWQGRWWTTS
jgi:hypothetical protein